MNTPIIRFGFYNRSSFAQRLNKWGLINKGVEIGTHRGDFACELLNKWKGVLYCIDPWLPGYDDEDSASHGDREADFEKTKTILDRFRSRVGIIRETSVDASKRFGDNCLDFVYVDGCHLTEHVYQDLSVWWPKIRLGGILAGHDFVSPGKDNDRSQALVQPAVFRFCGENSVRDLWLVVESNNKHWSYYMTKE